MSRGTGQVLCFPKIDDLTNVDDSKLEGATVERYSSQFKKNCLAEMWSGSEEGSYVRLIDSCITQLKAQGPSRTCNESQEDEEKKKRPRARLRRLPRLVGFLIQGFFFFFLLSLQVLEGP